MKSLKFRAWNSSSRKWEYFTPDNLLTYWDKLSDHVTNGDKFYISTGLLDKNNKEIYEGDIVKDHDRDMHSNQVPQIFVVEWGVLYDCDFPVKCVGFSFSSDDEFLEVIGNIYENPELLEGK